MFPRMLPRVRILTATTTDDFDMITEWKQNWLETVGGDNLLNSINPRHMPPGFDLEMYGVY